MEIRVATGAELEEVLELHRAAFPDEDVAGLVAALTWDAEFIPELSLVAADDGRVIGHIMFSRATAGAASAALLAPLGVLPQRQGHGVGTALVEEGLRRAAAESFQLALVLGHPDYYPRFGFVPAAGFGIEPPHSIVMPEAWMVLELTEGAADTASGVVSVAEALMPEEMWRE